MKNWFVVAAAATALATAAPLVSAQDAPPSVAPWRIDVGHSELTFRILTS